MSGWRAADASLAPRSWVLKRSRGAAEVLLVEQDAALVAKLRAIKERLKADAACSAATAAALRALAPQR